MELFTQLFGDPGLRRGRLCWPSSTTASTALSFTATSAGCRGPSRWCTSSISLAFHVVGEVLSQRTTDYQNWVEAFTANHRLPIEWAEKGVRKEDHVLPWQRRMVRADSYSVYCILKSMEQGLGLSRPACRNSPPRLPIIASWRVSAAASPTTGYHPH